jgi:hypothetical protein
LLDLRHAPTRHAFKVLIERGAGPSQGLLESLEHVNDRFAPRLRKFQTKLEPPPDRPIEQFGVVRGADHDAVGRQRVQLQQERIHYPLDLAGFMDVAALLPDRVELVEEQNARRGRGVVYDPADAGGRFSQVAVDDTVVADGEEG